jgi:hypothetical protein
MNVQLRLTGFSRCVESGSGLLRKSPEFYGLECVAVLNLVPPRFIHCRWCDIQQRLDDFGGEDLVCKLGAALESMYQSPRRSSGSPEWVLPG